MTMTLLCHIQALKILQNHNFSGQNVYQKNGCPWVKKEEHFLFRKIENRSFFVVALAPKYKKNIGLFIIKFLVKAQKFSR
jgi:hypothetical protein